MSANVPPRVIETDFFVRYAETDAMGVVHHANYLVYFEEGRSHYMRELGRSYAELETAGYRLPVTQLEVRYNGGLRYGQRVRVSTWIEENRSRRLTFAYEIKDFDDGARLVSGLTRHVWTDHAARVTRAPAAWTDLFRDGA